LFLRSCFFIGKINAAIFGLPLFAFMKLVEMSNVSYAAPLYVNYGGRLKFRKLSLKGKVAFHELWNLLPFSIERLEIESCGVNPNSISIPTVSRFTDSCKSSNAL
jgi:hypothetical protein